MGICRLYHPVNGIVSAHEIVVDAFLEKCPFQLIEPDAVSRLKKIGHLCVRQLQNPEFPVHLHLRHGIFRQPAHEHQGILRRNGKIKFPVGFKIRHVHVHGAESQTAGERYRQLPCTVPAVVDEVQLCSRRHRFLYPNAIGFSADPQNRRCTDMFRSVRGISETNVSRVLFRETCRKLRGLICIYEGNVPAAAQEYIHRQTRFFGELSAVKRHQCGELLVSRADNPG